MNKKGFTLVEAIIVTVIVGILAAVFIPMGMSAIEYRKKTSEVNSGFQKITEAIEAYYEEYGTYLNYEFTMNNSVTVDGILGINDDELNGEYFSSECYKFRYVKPNEFVVECDGSRSTAPKAEKVADFVKVIDQDGPVTSS